MHVCSLVESSERSVDITKATHRLRPPNLVAQFFCEIQGFCMQINRLLVPTQRIVLPKK